MIVDRAQLQLRMGYVLRKGFNGACEQVVLYATQPHLSRHGVETQEVVLPVNPFHGLPYLFHGLRHLMFRAPTGVPSTPLFVP